MAGWSIFAMFLQSTLVEISVVYYLVVVAVVAKYFTV